MYYLAYGSNLNIEQMKRRCPHARPVGMAWVQGYKLVFRLGFLTIEPEKDSRIDVAVWTVTPSDVEALDRYEGYPHLYHKKMLTILSPFSGSPLKKAMAYIMNDGMPIQRPSQTYMEIVKQGYKDFHLDFEPVLEAEREARRIEAKPQEGLRAVNIVKTSRNIIIPGIGRIDKGSELRVKSQNSKFVYVMIGEKQVRLSKEKDVGFFRK